MNIAIIGCGYIGMETAAIWTQKGFHVTATTRTPERLEALAKVAQKNVILKGNNEEEFVPLIANNEAILITISADNREHYESAYLHTAQIFRRLALEMNTPRDLIYTSSTSVYGDHHGRWVDENSDLLGQTQQARILIEAERTFRSLEDLGWNVCILRFAEIYGPGRSLPDRVKQLQNQTLPGAGDHYTNMVHKADCAGAIDHALRHEFRGLFNVSDDDHPTRRELYDQVARKLGCQPVQWDPNLAGLHNGNKRVSNHKIKSKGLSFQFPHRVLD